MKNKYLIGYKTFFGLLGFSAVVTEIATLAERGMLDVANFFSYFTILSNIFAIAMFFIGAYVLASGKKNLWVDYFRGAATFFMIVTGIVFAWLLSGLEGVQLTAVPWDNTVLHYIIPVAMAIDWIMNPPAVRFTFRQALAWLIFPIAYLMYSLFRGPIVNWYPYPFLNPANGGYGQILITSLIITAGGLLMIYLVTRIGQKAKTAKR
jgi:hypothetical protein